MFASRYLPLLRFSYGRVATRAAPLQRYLTARDCDVPRTWLAGTELVETFWMRFRDDFLEDRFNL